MFTQMKRAHEINSTQVHPEDAYCCADQTLRTSLQALHTRHWYSNNNNNQSL
jgi:hypothetical protein